MPVFIITITTITTTITTNVSVQYFLRITQTVNVKWVNTDVAYYLFSWNVFFLLISMVNIKSKVGSLCTNKC